MRYSRFVAQDAEDGLEATREHVKTHLAEIADADDDPNTHWDDVIVWTKPVPGGWLVYGELDAEPKAFYLEPDYDPETDTR